MPRSLLFYKKAFSLLKWALFILLPFSFLNAEEPKTEKKKRKNIKELLDRKGITFGIELTGVSTWDIIGGKERTKDGNLEYLLSINLAIDSAKAVGYEGGSFYADFEKMQGGMPSKEVGSYNYIASIEANPFTQLSELWYMQKLANGKFSMKIGKTDACDQFTNCKNTALFQNGAFITLATVHYLPTYPYPAMSAIATVMPNEHFTFASGVFDGSLANGFNTGKAGVFGHFFKDLSKHLFTINQADFFWKNKAGLEGRLAVGVWGDTAKVLSYKGGYKKGTWGPYGLIEQSLWQHGQRNIGFFCEYGYTNPKYSPVTNTLISGITLRGISTKRPLDVMGGGYGFSGFSRKDKAVFIKPSEMVIECFYNAYLVSWMTFQADAQYIRHPGGSNNPSAFVILVQLSFQK